MADSDIERLRDAIDHAWEEARNFGLDPFPTHFELVPAESVLDQIRKTDEFKFNVNLVILDFALRNGLIPVDDPEYLEVASGLHRPLD